MSPLLKAIGVGIAVFAVSLLLLWGISRAMKRPFLPRFPRAAPTVRVTPTPPPPTFPTS